MRLHQLFEKVQIQEVEQISKDTKFWEMVSHLDENLPDAAQEAISAWVGGDVKFKDTGASSGIMIADKLERAFEMVPSRQSQQVRNELNAAMAPVRAYLRSKYGDKIEVHRGYGREVQKDVRVVGGVDTRRLLSYTSNKQVANHFAGAQARYATILTDDQIDALVDQYVKTGKTKAFKKTYIHAVEEMPEMTTGDVEHKYLVWVIDDGQTKHEASGGQSIYGLMEELSKLGAFPFDKDRSKLNADGGIVTSEDGKVFKCYKEERTQTIKDRVHTGKMLKYDVAKVAYRDTGDEEEYQEDDIIDGSPEDIRAEITRDNDYRKEHNAEQEQYLRRVRTVMVSVDDIVWVTDRFNQQEFIVYVGNDEDKLNPKFD